MERVGAEWSGTGPRASVLGVAPLAAPRTGVSAGGGGRGLLAPCSPVTFCLKMRALGVWRGAGCPWGGGADGSPVSLRPVASAARDAAARPRLPGSRAVISGLKLLKT